MFVPGWDGKGGSLFSDARLEAIKGARWYALRVRSNFERKVCFHLQCRDVEVFLPTYKERRRWSDRVKVVERPLFPGYLFCRTQTKQGPVVVTVPGVVGVVGNTGAPEPIPDGEIEAVQKMVASGEGLLPWPYLQVGQRVAIEHGALTGLEGVLLQVKSSFRVVVSIPLLQRSISAVVDRECIRPIGQAMGARAGHA